MFNLIDGKFSFVINYSNSIVTVEDLISELTVEKSNNTYIGIS